MSNFVELPEKVQAQVDTLIEMEHPLLMSVSSTKYVARQEGLLDLAEYLESSENAGKYISYVMTFEKSAK